MGPLASLEQWDDFVQERYQPNKKQEEFRQYDDSAPPVVREFYRLNHTHQTVDFVRQKKRQYLAKDRASGLQHRSQGEQRGAPSTAAVVGTQLSEPAFGSSCGFRGRTERTLVAAANGLSRMKYAGYGKRTPPNTRL